MSGARRLSKVLQTGIGFIPALGATRAVSNEAKGEHLAMAVRSLSEPQIQKAIGLVKPWVNLDGFRLTKMGMVEHSFGDKTKPAEVAIVRFERSDGVNNGIGGEHISASVNLSNNTMMGFTRMQACLAGKPVNHETALNQAVNFLHHAAKDLMPAIPSAQHIKAHVPGAKITFTDKPQLGNLEICWIGNHDEVISVDGKSVVVNGMKVKTRIPERELWAWVILDKEGGVQTFERDIYWDFSKGERGTQKWLHDSWLISKKLDLLEVPRKASEETQAVAPESPRLRI